MDEISELEQLACEVQSDVDCSEISGSVYAMLHLERLLEIVLKRCESERNG